MLLNVLDFPSPQQALDAADNGDRVYFPSARKWDAPPGGFIIRKDIELFGDGAGNVADTSGTTLFPSSIVDPNDPTKINHVIVVDPPTGVELQNIYLHDFKISRAIPPAQSGADGIHVKLNPGQKLSKVGIDRVIVLNMPTGYGIRLEGLNAANEAIVLVSMRDCACSFCGRGLSLDYVFNADLQNCNFTANNSYGVFGLRSGIGLYLCGLQDNCKVPPAEDANVANLTLDTCHIARVDGCHFEDIANGPKVGCFFNKCGGSAHVSGCFFVNGVGATGIKIPGDPDSGPIMIGVNRFSNVTTLVDCGDVPNVVMDAQFSQSASPSIVLPAAPTGFAGAPHIKVQVASGGDNLLSGVATTSKSGLPTVNLRGGMLAYDRQVNELKAWIAAGSGAWQSLSQITDAGISPTAGIQGSKLSSVTGNRITRSKLEDACIDDSAIAAPGVSLLKLKAALLTLNLPAAIAGGATQGYDISTFSGPSGINFDTAKPVCAFIFDQNMPAGTNPASRPGGLLIPYISLSAGSPAKWYFMVRNPTGSSISATGLIAEVFVLRV